MRNTTVYRKSLSAEYQPICFLSCFSSYKKSTLTYQSALMRIYRLQSCNQFRIRFDNFHCRTGVDCSVITSGKIAITAIGLKTLL